MNLAAHQIISQVRKLYLKAQGLNDVGQEMKLPKVMTSPMVT